MLQHADINVSMFTPHLSVHAGSWLYRPGENRTSPSRQMCGQQIISGVWLQQ
jgi:hypothetical protein